MHFNVLSVTAGANGRPTSQVLVELSKDRLAVKLDEGILHQHRKGSIASLQHYQASGTGERVQLGGVTSMRPKRVMHLIFQKHSVITVEDAQTEVECDAPRQPLPRT